jgi:hypothetical protein
MSAGKPQEHESTRGGEEELHLGSEEIEWVLKEDSMFCLSRATRSHQFRRILGIHGVQVT